MNKKIVLLELGEAVSHLQELIGQIKQENGLKNPYTLEINLKHIIAHISRAYNYRDTSDEEYLAPPESKIRKMCQPPKELIPFADDPADAQ